MSMVRWHTWFWEEYSGKGDWKDTVGKAEKLGRFPKGTGEPQKVVEEGRNMVRFVL